MGFARSDVKTKQCHNLAQFVIGPQVQMFEGLPFSQF